MAGHQGKLRYIKNGGHTGHSDKIKIIHGTAMNSIRIIVPAALKVLEQLHLNHMGIEKKRLLACESIYSVNNNAD